MEKPLEKGNGGPSERHRESLQDILDKSSRLMAQVGFHGTTMRDLARATGRSLAGLYHYFSSKEDLLFLINYHGFTQLGDIWRAMAPNLSTPEERLYGFIYLHTRYYVANIDDMKVMNWGTQTLSYERAMTIRELKDRHTADARALVAQAYRNAVGAEVEPQRLERLTYLLFGMMNWIFGWYSRPDHGDVDELIRDIYGTFMKGIGGRIDNIDRTEAAVARAYARVAPASLVDAALAGN